MTGAPVRPAARFTTENQVVPSTGEIASIAGNPAGTTKGPNMKTTTRNFDRKYFVIDLENLIGGDEKYSEDLVRFVWSTIKPWINNGDQVIVASALALAKYALFALKDENIRYYLRSGLNGADNELLYRIDEDRAANRYSTLVIASGDHAFAELAMRANHAGMTTWRVSGNGTPSRALDKACSLHAHLKVSRADRLRASRKLVANVA